MSVQPPYLPARNDRFHGTHSETPVQDGSTEQCARVGPCSHMAGSNGLLCATLGQTPSSSSLGCLICVRGIMAPTGWLLGGQKEHREPYPQRVEEWGSIIELPPVTCRQLLLAALIPSTEPFDLGHTGDPCWPPLSSIPSPVR